VSKLEGRSKAAFAYNARHLEFRLEHPGGGTNQQDVNAQSLSTHDIVVVHKGFVHTGSSCTIVLPTLDGNEKVMLAGQVTACQHLEGMHHEVHVHFDGGIDPRYFVKLSDEPQAQAFEGFDLMDLAGQVLLVEDQEAVCRLMAYELRLTRVGLVTAPNLEQARLEIERRSLDLIICSLDLPQDAGQQAVEAIRSAGFEGPVIGLTGDPEAEQAERTEAEQATGISTVIAKPYDRDQLLMILAKWLGGIDPEGDNQLIFSRLKDDRSMIELLGWYLQQVRSVIDELRKGIKRGDVDEVTKCCRFLYETAQGYGYEPVLDAARQARGTLRQSGSIPASLSELKHLESICQRMR